MKKLLAIATALLVVACQTAPPAPPPEPAPAVVEVAPLPPEPPPSFRLTAPSPLPARPYSFPEVRRITLDNGLRILIVENHDSPLVALRVLTRSGAAQDPENRAGLAAVTADMLDEGAGKRTALQVAEDVGKLGAQLTATADWDASTISIDTLGRNTATALDLLADLAIKPRFESAEFSRVKKDRLTTLLQQKDQAPIMANIRFSGFVYGGTPYGHAVQGSDASVATMTRDDVRRFHARHYIPNNTSLIVAGDVDADEIVEMARKTFGSWKKGTAVPDVTVSPKASDGSRIYLIDRPAAVQSEIRVGHAGVARSNDDYFPVLVMNTVLGGISSARIYQNLREKRGYTYSVQSQFQFRRGPGPFVVSTPVRNEVTTPSVRVILDELRRIRTGDVSDDELQRAKSNRMGIFPATVEGAANIANRVIDMEVFGLSDDYFDKYRERIAAVTKNDVVRVANQYVNPDRASIVIVGRASEIASSLRELEIPVDVYDIEGKLLQ